MMHDRFFSLSYLIKKVIIEGEGFGFLWKIPPGTLLAGLANENNQ